MLSKRYATGAMYVPEERGATGTSNKFATDSFKAVVFR